ncbi:MAG TPA: chemotaxis protein CheB [Chloroflexota bacterium]|nr:chemotaxis protein CheB [Chloroflexota bacterium]
MIRVLLADASSHAERTRRALSEQPDVQLLAMCRAGEELIRQSAALHPDVVITDLMLDGLSAVEAIRQLMSTAPVPVLLFGPSVTRHDAPLVRDGLAAGSTDVLAGFPDNLDQLADHVRLLAKQRTRTFYRQRHTPPEHTPSQARGVPELIVIGASTGGPPALSSIVQALPRGFAVPVAVGQHIGAGFVGSLAAMLGRVHPRIRVVEGQQRIEPGAVYLAADGRQLHVAARGWMDVQPPEHPVQPLKSIDAFFESAALAYGSRLGAVVLTGMGRDGASGLLAIRQAGGRTMVQAPETCAIDGMPRAAIDLGAPEQVVPLERIGPEIANWLEGA